MDGSPNIDEHKDSLGFDLVATDFDSEIIENFPQLKLFRASRTDKIKKITFKNIPNLEVIDLNLSNNLTEIEIINCNSLKALDVSFCLNLKQIKGNFPNLEYFSCPNTPITNLPAMPKLLYLNASWCGSLQRVNINDFKNLEKVSFGAYESWSYSMSEISSHPSLVELHTFNVDIDFNKFSKKSKLKYFSMKRGTINGNISIMPDDVFIILPNESTHGKYREIGRLKSDDSLLLLYGPWGVPPAENKILSPIIGTFKPPENYNLEKASDCIAGCIFGSAIMDMIGSGVEFETKAVAHQNLGKPLDITWTHPWMSQFNASYIKGTATDDTSQAVLIMRSLVSANSCGSHFENMLSKNNVNLDIQNFAKQMFYWMKEGHPEHKDGCGLGMGRTTKAVLTNPNFLTNPHKASEEIWIALDRNVASNGAVMRTGPVGCFCFWDEEVVKFVAENLAKVTHFDPRCVFSAVLISVIVSRIIRSKTSDYKFDLDETIENSFSFVPGIEKYKDEAMKHLTVKNIEKLNLEDQNQQGFTFKTIGAAIWALRYCTSYEEALVRVVREGGDSDTNGAVVGAIMGCKTGYSKLPRDLLQYMFMGQWLYNEMDPFMRTMGVNPPKSYWVQ